MSKRRPSTIFSLQSEKIYYFLRKKSGNDLSSAMISALIAYNFLPQKPSLNLEIVDIQNVNNLKRIA